MTTGKRMKKRRKEIGLSAETVADRLGVSPATIYRYENGDIDKVPGKTLAPIADILHTTPAYLMGWTDDYYDYDKDEDCRLSEVPYAQFKALMALHHDDLEAVWKAWTDIQSDTLSSSGVRRNLIKLVGRDGSVVIKELTDAELAAYKTFVDKLPEADDL